MSTIKVDTVRPVTADASLTLQGDNSGTGVSGITIDSSGNATFAQPISGASLTGTEIDLKSSGTTIYKSDGTTGIVSESSGIVTFDNAIVGNDYTGILEVDQWYLTADVGGGDITTNWARNNFTGFSKIGTGLTESSGIFTFPRTGVYEILVAATLLEDTGASDPNMGVILKVSTDNGSNYSDTAYARGHVLNDTYATNVVSSHILNVNNIDYSGSNGVLFKLNAVSVASGNYVNGSELYMFTNFSIKRLGPAQ